MIVDSSTFPYKIIDSINTTKHVMGSKEGEMYADLTIASQR